MFLSVVLFSVASAFAVSPGSPDPSRPRPLSSNDPLCQTAPEIPLARLLAAVNSAPDLTRRMRRDLAPSLKITTQKILANRSLSREQAIKKFRETGTRPIMRHGLDIYRLAEKHYVDAIKNISPATDLKRHTAAVQNWKHIQRAIDAVRDAYIELEALGIDTESLIYGILLSDIGKEEEFIKELMEKHKIGAFQAFLLHEEIGLQLLVQYSKTFEIDPVDLVNITKVILAHNGPATEGTFWGIFWAKFFPERPYGTPESNGAFVHAALDRADQGRLVVEEDGVTVGGGCIKILNDLLRAPNAKFAAAVKESLGNNPAKTLEQIAELRLLADPKGLREVADQIKESGKPLAYKIAGAYNTEEQIRKLADDAEKGNYLVGIENSMILGKIYEVLQTQKLFNAHVKIDGEKVFVSNGQSNVEVTNVEELTAQLLPLLKQKK